MEDVDGFMLRGLKYFLVGFAEFCVCSNSNMMSVVGEKILFSNEHVSISLH